MLECHAIWPKECRATYQMEITTIFHDIFHITMEDYVDDLLAKSITRQGHIGNLVGIFDRLEE